MSANQDDPEQVPAQSDGIRSPQPRLGIVYTRERIVDLCLDLLQRHLHGPLLGRRVLDVGCGYGQFCGPLAKRLAIEKAHQGTGWADFRDTVLGTLRGVEIRPETADLARAAIGQAIKEETGRDLSSTNLETIIREEDFLTWDPQPTRFDAIVGNIPYVRYRQIRNLSQGTEVSQLRKTFSCFRGRADYSIPFLERISKLLDPEGVAVLISSNRFTRAEYGQSLRAHLAEGHHQLHEIDLSDIRAFQSEVSAYASIFLLIPKGPSESIYARLLSDDSKLLSRVARNFPEKQETDAGIELTSRGTLPPEGLPWSTLPDLITSTLKRLSEEFEPLSATDTTVRKGPATGANSVFIREWSEFPFSEAVKTENLLPLFHWGSQDNGAGPEVDRYLLSVFEEGTKRLLSTEDLHPEIAEYLQEHREDLEARHIVETQGRPWWRTIDKFDPALKEEPKILIPDLRLSDRVVFDDGRVFPSHTVVYVTGGDEKLLRGLTLVLRSPIADEYRFWRSPDMGRNSPRASSKMLREFPVPDVKRLQELGQGTKGDADVYDLYGLNEAEVEAFETRRSQRRASRNSGR